MHFLAKNPVALANTRFYFADWSRVRIFHGFRLGFEQSTLSVITSKNLTVLKINKK